MPHATLTTPSDFYFGDLKVATSSPFSLPHSFLKAPPLLPMTTWPSQGRISSYRLLPGSLQYVQTPKGHDSVSSSPGCLMWILWILTWQALYQMSHLPALVVPSAFL